MSRPVPQQAALRTPRQALARRRIAAALFGLAALTGTAAAATAPDIAGATAAANAADNAATPPAPHGTRRAAIKARDMAILSAPISLSLGERVPSADALVIQAHATAMRPAPLPDQDVDAPGPDTQTLAAQQQASLSPSVYGQTKHFSGDGFATGSNLENEQNNRRRPGGGMSLSIPVP